MIMGGLTFGIRPLTLLGSIVLARLLDPSDFGAVALAMVYLGISELFAGFRMEQAYVQSDQDPHSAAFHGFVVTAVSGTLLFAASFLNASWIATILGDVQIAPLLQALSLMILFDSLASIPTGELRKQMMFGKIASTTLIATLVYLAVTVVLALFGFGVWSLVIGQIIRSLTGTIAVWYFAPGWDWIRPVPWDSSVFRSLMRFGVPATAAGLVTFLSSKWDDWLVGRQLGIDSLGYYSKAYDFTNRTIRSFGTQVVGSVFLPAYVRIRHDAAKLQKAYLKSVQSVSTMMFPIALGFFSTAPLLIPVVLGEKWVPMVSTFQVFAILILTRPISINTSTVFNASGVPEDNLKSGLVLLAVMAPLAVLLLRFGIVGVAAAVLIGDTAGLLFNLYRINKMLPGSFRETIRVSMPAFGAAFIMLLVVLATRALVVPRYGANWVSLTIAIVAGVIVYFASSLVLQRKFTMDVVRTMLDILDTKGKLDQIRVRLGV